MDLSIRHRRSFKHRVVRTGLIGGAIAASLVVTGVASAQRIRLSETDDGQADGPRQSWRAGGGAGEMRAIPGRRRMMDEFGPRITRNELDLMKEKLEISDGDFETILMAYEGYRQATTEALDTFMESMPPLQLPEPDEDGNVEFEFDSDSFQERMEETQTRGAEYRETRERLRTEFLDVVKSVLSEEALNDWTSYERGLRRRSTLSRRAALKGEGIDLVHLVKEMEWPDERTAAIRPALDRYEEDLDGVLVARDEALDDVQAHIGAIGPMMGGGPNVMFQDVIDRGTERRFAVLDTNLRYLGILEASLGGKDGEALRDAFNRRAYPAQFRSTQADRYLEKIKADEELTYEQEQSIEGVEANYRAQLDQLTKHAISLEQRKLGDIRNRLFAPEDDEENIQQSVAIQSFGGEAMVMTNNRGSEETERQIRETRSRKRELVDNTLDALFAALNVDQQERMPRPPSMDSVVSRLREKMGDGNFSFGDFGSLPEGFSPEEMQEILQAALEGIELDMLGSGDTDVQVHTMSVPGEDGETGVAVAITVMETAEEGDGEDGTQDEVESGGGGN